MRVIGFSVLLIMGIFSTAQADTTAFLNVNVVPMDSPRVLSDHTVIVEGRSIVALAPSAELSAPEGATIIDGRGRFLMPGLADMHMHLQADMSYSDPEQLLFFLAQGTTTIRVLGAPPVSLDWRDRVERGDLIGPKVLVMGPTLVGNFGNSMGLQPIMLGMNSARVLVPLLLALVIIASVKSWRTRRGAIVGIGAGVLVAGLLVATELPRLNIFNPIFDVPQSHVVEDRASPVLATVARYAADGYDGVKLYDGLSEAQFNAAISEADRRGLYTTGHLLHQVPLERQLASGLREVAHADEFLSHHWIGYNLGQDPDPQYAETFDFPVDMDAIPHTAEMVARGGVNVVSNLSTDEALYRLLLDLDATLAEPRYSKFRPDLVAAWKTGGRHFGPFLGQGENRRDVIQPFLSTLMKSFHDAGVPILIGTDAGGFAPEGSIPSDIHRELELLVDAGLTNFDALAAGTITAGNIVALMTGDENHGTLKVGNAANLLLLKSNPLDSVSATRTRVGVMANGTWYPQKRLNEMVSVYLSSRDW